MGRKSASTVTLDAADIIRVAVIGDPSGESAQQHIKEIEAFIRQLRARRKKVLILADLTRMGASDTAARKLVRQFLQRVKYDRIAYFGANRENSRIMQYMLGTIARVLRMKPFTTEPHAVRWLQTVEQPPAIKARRLLAAAAGVAVFGLVWQQYIGPGLLRLPDDFSYEASVISYDDFYNEQTASFGGKSLSDTKFTYRTTANKDGVLDIKNLFDVRTTAGEKVFAVERTYGIDPQTRMHVPGHGDRNRSGYLFAPPNLAKQDFTYWHVNYDEPAVMKFQAEDDILGLTTYRYAADYHADQTKDLAHLPGVGESRGIELDINLQLWVEPQTGYLVKYEDRATAYYYDLATGQRLNPWNRFSNSYSFDSIAGHVQKAEQAKQRKQFVETGVPIFLAIVGFILLAWMGIVMWQAHSRQSALLLMSPRMGLLLSLLVFTVLMMITVMFWRQTLAGTARQTNLQFQSNVHDLNDTIANELTGYVKALQGAKGLFAASQEVNRQEWKAYVDGLQLPQNYAGMLAMGFAQAVSSDQKTSHISAIRSQGFPAYTITPEGLRDTYSPVVYIEPFNEHNNQRAFGYDMFAEPVRRAALERARDTGEAALSGKVILRQDDGIDRQSGMLLYVPVYRRGMPLASPQQRRQALSGYVYAPIRLADFMHDTVGKQTHGLNIEIFDASAPGALAVANRMYVTDSRYGLESRNYTPELVRTEPLAVAGRTITLRYSTLPGYNTGITQALPAIILLNGILLSVLLSALVYSLGSARLRALQLASGMTVDLRNERNIATANQRKVEAILASIGDGVFVIDRSGKIILFNKAAELISGFPAREALGRPYKKILEFSDEKNGVLVDRFIDKALAGFKSEMPRHTLLRRKDTTTIPVADSAAPIINTRGSTEGAVVIFRDVTRERQLEAMKDEFLSIASHELRTPMGAVRANVSMMLAGDYGAVNKGLVEPLTDVHNSTVRLVRMVNDLLDVARIEAGRMKFTLDDTDIREPLRQAIASLAPLGKEKGVRIILAASAGAHDPAGFKVQADPDKLRQVITNLIGNALKFTDKGSITVAVSVSQDFAEVSVTDTGIGIAAKEQSKLFGKFSQISSQQTGKPAGTGLGLYISREIIRKMGGELWLKSSEPGTGSVFAFTIPRASTPGAQRARKMLEREAALHP